MNLIVMLCLMSMNIFTGLFMSNINWLTGELSAFDLMMLMVFILSVISSFIYLYYYPYQMARADYKNQVMSLMIASGVSRVKYYFVKIGSVFLFSLMSVIVVGLIPIIVVIAANGGMGFSFEIFNFYFQLVDMVSWLFFAFLNFLSMFSMLMTSVILTKGKGYTIFVYLGISLIGMILFFVFDSLIYLGTGVVGGGRIFDFIQYVLTISLMLLIGVLVIKNQDL